MPRWWSICRSLKRRAENLDWHTLLLGCGKGSTSSAWAWRLDERKLMRRSQGMRHKEGKGGKTMKGLYAGLLLRLTSCLLLTGLACFCAVSVQASEKSGPGNTEYSIEKGDVLEINVWREENLTRTVTVRKDGKISLPLVDDVQAAGRTPTALKQEVTDRLRQYIESPEVTVIVNSQAGHQFYVMGEVQNIGVYPLIQDTTIVQALARTGGFTEWADKDDIVILRRVEGKERRIEVDYEAIVAGEAENVLLQSNDTVIVR